MIKIVYFVRKTKYHKCTATIKRLPGWILNPFILLFFGKTISLGPGLKGYLTNWKIFFC